ncbi:MAG: hypothetical protein ACJ789_10770 [Thermomicrobiales bacterium]
MAKDEKGDFVPTPGQGGKDPAEQERLAQTLADELEELFLHFVRGEASFADITFEVFEALQDLYIIASGDYELEYEDVEEYDVVEATSEQENLAQEPSRNDS